MQSYTFTNRNELVTRPTRNRLKTLIAISFLLMLFTVFIQLFVMSQYATKGDEIAKLEQKRQSLNNENIKLNREIAAAKNLDYIKSRSENLGYVPLDAKEVKYLTLQEK